MSKKGAQALMNRVFEEVWNQQMLDVIDQTHADDFVFHDPVSPDHHGPEGYRQVVTTYTTAFPDIHFEVEEYVMEGDKKS